MAALSVLWIFVEREDVIGRLPGFQTLRCKSFIALLAAFPASAVRHQFILPNHVAETLIWKTHLIMVDSLLPGRVLPVRSSFFSLCFFIPSTGGVQVTADEHFVREVAYPRGYSGNYPSSCQCWQYVCREVPLRLTYYCRSIFSLLVIAWLQFRTVILGFVTVVKQWWVNIYSDIDCVYITSLESPAVIGGHVVVDWNQDKRRIDVLNPFGAVGI